VLNFDINDFATSIANLRKIVAHRDNPDTTEYVLTGYIGSLLSDGSYTKDGHPVLARPRANQPPRWIHIKLLAAGEEMPSTTIAVRDDNCCGFGFRNQSGVWYDLGNWHGNRALPAQYNSVLLDWGVSSEHTTLSVVKDWDEAISYKDILNVNNWNEAVSNLESSVTQGKNFAEKAVRTLWRYPDVEEGVNPRLALAGIMVMVCESAKLNTLYEYFVERWDTGTGTQSFSELRLMDHIRNWGDISRALLYWRDHGYCKWHKYLPKETMDIINGGVDPSKEISDRADQALGIVHLVFNWQDQIDMEYDIEGEKRFTAFIGELREKLAYHVDREDLLDRRLDLPAAFSSSDNNHPVLARYRAGQPARWFHIKLKLMEENKEEKSTTLAIRDDNLLVVGFMNEKGIWYELPNLFKQSTGSGIRILPAEYNSELLDWDWSMETMRDILAGFYMGQPSTFLRNLSSHDPGDGSAMWELMGLTIMVCESARLNSICDFFASGGVGDKFAATRHHKPWKYDNIEEVKFIEDLLRHITNWDLLSDALLTWKDGGYFYNISDEKNLKNTLVDIHLVLNRQPPPRLYEIYDHSSFA